MPASHGGKNRPIVPSRQTIMNIHRKIRSITIATYFQSSFTCAERSNREGGENKNRNNIMNLNNNSHHGWYCLLWKIWFIRKTTHHTSYVIYSCTFLHTFADLFLLFSSVNAICYNLSVTNQTFKQFFLSCSQQ